jgi:carbonic anhydrase/acetyltransferase-like protein (isoleucine patch superfamily)
MALVQKVRGFTPKIDQSAWLAENAVVVGDVVIGQSVMSMP